MERDIPAQPQVAPRETAQGSSRFLLLVVFLAGIGTLGIEMVASTLPSARGMKTQELIDATLMEELVKEGRCN